MKYYLVFGVMFNKVVVANGETEVSGRILRELTKEEVDALEVQAIPNAD